MQAPCGAGWSVLLTRVRGLDAAPQESSVSTCAMVSGQTLSQSQPSVHSGIRPQVGTDVTERTIANLSTKTREMIPATTCSPWVSYEAMHKDQNFLCWGKPWETPKTAGRKSSGKERNRSRWHLDCTSDLLFILSHLPKNREASG